MSTTRGKKDRNVKDMFTKMARASGGDGRESPTASGGQEIENTEEPVTRTFLAQLFFTLREVLQALRKAFLWK